MVTFTEKEFKSILNVRKYIDSWFWDKYSISGYNGCQFGCIYCDTRSAKYQMPLDFENNIIVKKDVTQMLDKRIINARTLLPDVVGMSGASDPYQPAERKFRNTRKCLEVLEKHNYPVHIITKSKYVLDDIELLNSIGKKSWCSVSVTITTTSEEVSRFVEKRVPLPSARFDIIKKIKSVSTSIQTGVLMLPVIPYLTDSEENLESLVKASKQAGADYLLFGGGMTMRDIQALWFLKHLENEFPELISKYEHLYKFRYNPGEYLGEYETPYNYYKNINKLLFNLCKKYNIPIRMKRYIPNDFRRLNYLISESFFSETFEKQILGNPDTNLYWAAMNIQNLKEPIYDITKRNELMKIKNVNRFVKEKIINELKKYYPL